MCRNFKRKAYLINYKDHTLEEVIERSSRLITLIDLAGDRKYLKTTIYGVSGYQPHYCVLIINAKTGATAVTREHLGLAIALDIPVFVIITKVDLVDDKQHERVLRSVENLISTLGRKIVAKRILCRDDIISCADSMPNREILPIFSVSSVTGLNLDLLTPFLNLLPQINPSIFKQCNITSNNSPLFYVDEIFQSEKVGTVVCGILSEGVIHQGQSIQIGPDKEGCYAKGVVESIHRNKQPVQTIYAETPMAVSFRISFISPMKDSLKRGMVLISSEGSAVCCRRFVARFCLLNHPSREICIGFQGTVYIGSLCRTVSVVNFDSPSIQPCEWLDVEFEFWQQAEFLRTGMPLIFRERRTKGMGEVIRIHPLQTVLRDEENQTAPADRTPKKKQDRSDGLNATHLPVREFVQAEAMKKSRRAKHKRQREESTGSMQQIDNRPQKASTKEVNIFASMLKQKKIMAEKRQKQQDPEDEGNLSTENLPAGKKRQLSKADSIVKKERSTKNVLLPENNGSTFTEEDVVIESDENGFSSPEESSDSCSDVTDQEDLSSDQFEKNSVQAGLNALAWIISPLDVQTFFAKVFQKRALVVKRGSYKDKQVNYLANFFTTQHFVEMLQKNFIEYGMNINVAKYENGIRTTHNGKGRVYPRVVQEHLSERCSIQCVNPQSFNDNIWYLCEILQEVFCSFVGANNYLTPANSAGFAPHWDDVDAFLLQTEGRKHWKVYAPPNEDSTLPMVSSENFTDSDFLNRKPAFNGWLEAGDLLYLPRGFIHQAKTDSQIHSHHVTVSVCRNITYSHLLENGLTQYLETMTDRSQQLRKSLPPMLLDMIGTADVDYSSEEHFEKKLVHPCRQFLKSMVNKFAQFLPSLVDLSAQEFMRTALPPLLTPLERDHSCQGQHNLELLAQNETTITHVRLIRKHALRLVYASEDNAFIVHRMENSRVYEGRPEVTLEFPLELEQGYNELMNAYPTWISTQELGLEKNEAVALVKLLFNNCLLLVKEVKKQKSTKQNERVNGCKDELKNQPMIAKDKNNAKGLIKKKKMDKKFEKKFSSTNKQ
ncbi:cupin superfamily protein domain-containing protein [Ditylenchus destructor]|uniref:Bifunctional lysine-specific demethylase and histidyl-hydroxylase NO66 n=1 Tax=Ditylenchus destructor TaxID=166010 RepID=A0AAD4NDM7_9BILA|nr:cupin superfamily protein domain-containing protein [Ditylenchus destructor]